MREILGLCVKMDRFAEELYANLADACTDRDLAATFARLAEDEAEHTGWWEGLLDAWGHGLLPDLVNDTTDLAQRLDGVYEELAQVDLADLGLLSTEQMLALAARVEFYMIDPVFSELIDLTEPARAERRHAAYQMHIQRLVDEIGRHYPSDSLATLLAVALSRSWRDNLRLSAYATHDALTGLYNRRALYTHLPQWTAWSARYGHPLAVLLVDIDYFKQVNDRFGHATGDRVLREIAQVMRRAVRASDLVVRYGGDEFAVVAPETGAQEYADLCERIVDTVRATSILTDHGERLKVAVSVGGTIAQDAAGAAPYRIESLLAAADQSLYAAKHAGRDRAAAPVPSQRS